MRWDGPDGYWASDDPALIDAAQVHRWISEEAYWAKPTGGRFEPVPRERALSEAGSASYYALGLFVVTPR